MHALISPDDNMAAPNTFKIGQTSSAAVATSKCSFRNISFIASHHVTRMSGSGEILKHA